MRRSGFRMDNEPRDNGLAETERKLWVIGKSENSLFQESEIWSSRSELGRSRSGSAAVL